MRRLSLGLLFFLVACGPDPERIAAIVKPMIQAQADSAFLELYRMRADTQDMRLLREGAVIPDSNILVTGLTLLREDRHHLIGTATMRTFRRTTETVIRVTVDGDRLMWKSDGPFSGIVAIMEDHARWDAEKAERRLRTYLGH